MTNTTYMHTYAGRGVVRVVPSGVFTYEYISSLTLLRSKLIMCNTTVVEKKN